MYNKVFCFLETKDYVYLTFVYCLPKKKQQTLKVFLINKQKSSQTIKIESISMFPYFSEL